MNNKRTGGRAALYGKNVRDRSGIECICAQAVDGFGGKGDQATGTKNLCGLINLRLGNVLGMRFLDDE
jgi:hypothetical protein